MLIPHMKSSNDSTKIETVGVQLLIGRLREDSHISYNFSPIDTPFITINNYDHYNISIPYKHSTPKSIRETSTSCFISLLFITGTESLPTKSPGVHVDNNSISIQQLLHLIPIENP